MKTLKKVAILYFLIMISVAIAATINPAGTAAFIKTLMFWKLF